MPSKKLAIDIVILPTADIAEQIISINQQAAVKGGVWGPLGKDDFMPHMSLAMGGIKNEDLETVKKVIENIAKKFSHIVIELNGLYYDEKPDGSRTYAIRAKNTPQLQQLHENLMNELKQYFSYNCTKEMLYSRSGEEVREPSYVNEFPMLYSFKNFDPHITTRTKEAVGQENLPMKFTATEITACQIGIRTTCRKRLFTIKFRKR